MYMYCIYIKIIYKNPSVMNTICISLFRYTHVITYNIYLYLYLYLSIYVYHVSIYISKHTQNVC